MIELAPGEQRQLNIALTPVAVTPQIAITELFVGTTMDTDRQSADCCYYIALTNSGAAPVSGILNLYDWQAWWGHKPGDERNWAHPSFTIPAGGTYRYRDTIHELANDLTYFRWEVVVNNAVVLETPRIYIKPGKEYEGSESIAVGECTYKASGLAVLWYSQRSECQVWNGNLHTPATRPFQHYVSWGPFRTTSYETGIWWPAVFVPIIDPDFISGALYEAYILGGGAGAAWRGVWFTFTAA